MEPGTLYVIASPIGNMEDMTLRAIKILKESIDLVYCEDTRQTKKLLNHYSIDVPARSLHSHSPQSKIDGAVAELLAGKSIAYLSDSGTPGLSDPGSRIVNEARKNNILISPIPGPSALGSIISVAGFPEKNVIFTGFLSKKERRRKKELEKLKNIPGIIVIYESPHRIVKLLNAVHEVFPGAQMLIGREMTKFYEEFIHGTTDEIMGNIESLKQKGEFTVAVLNDGNEKKKINEKE